MNSETFAKLYEEYQKNETLKLQQEGQQFGYFLMVAFPLSVLGATVITFLFHKLGIHITL